MNIKFIKSENFNERKKDINTVVIHYTDTMNITDAINILCDKKKEVSAHYAIDITGDIYNLVSEDKRAWHAGISNLYDETDVNSISIGIELQNKGKRFGYHKYPDEQINSLIELLKDINTRHAIKYYVGHDDIAPDRKIDPGSLFPWEVLKEHKFNNPFKKFHK